MNGHHDGDLRFALYHPWIYLRSGVERMIVELATRSRHDWTVFTHHLSRDTTYPELADVHVVELRPGVSVQRSAAPIGTAAARIAATRLPDVGASGLLVSSEGLGDLIAARATLPVVAYCHTPLKIIHDPQTRQRLRQRDPIRHAAAVALGPAFTALDRAMWARFEYAFANSAEVARRVERAGLVTRQGIEVLHPGVDLDLRLDDGAVAMDGSVDPDDGPARFVVAGRIMWQKRIEVAIDALRWGIERDRPWQLDVYGAVDDKSESYLAELRARAVGLPVRFHRGRPDAEVRAAMRDATATLLTAPNEDFGMVVLEALALGTPVIAANRGGPAEILTDRSGWLVEVDDAAGFAAAMQAAAAARGAKRTGARRRAEDFGWDRFVERVDDVMAAVAAGRRVR